MSEKKPLNPFVIKNNVLFVDKEKLEKNLRRLKKIADKKKKILKKADSDEVDFEKLMYKVALLDRAMDKYRLAPLMIRAIRKAYGVKKGKKISLINSECSAGTEKELLKYEKKVLSVISGGVYTKRYINKKALGAVLWLPKINDAVQKGKIILKDVSGREKELDVDLSKGLSLGQDVEPIHIDSKDLARHLAVFGTLRKQV